jgi:hypothetical protein
MKFSNIVVAVVAFSLSAVPWTFASAQTMPISASPIQVLNMQYTENSSSSEDEGGNNSVLRPGIMVTFKNVTSRPIHAVIFAITDSSGFQLGTYFGDVRLKDKHGLPVRATTTQVGFTDGTMWSSTK